VARRILRRLVAEFAAAGRLGERDDQLSGAGTIREVQGVTMEHDRSEAKESALSQSGAALSAGGCRSIAVDLSPSAALPQEGGRQLASVAASQRAMPMAGERIGKGAQRSLALLAAGAVLLLLWLARELLIPVTLGIFLACAVWPIVIRLERLRVPHGVAAVAGTLLTSLVVAGVFAILYNGLAAFAQDLPAYEGRLRAALKAITAHITHLEHQGERLVTSPPGGVKVQQALPWGLFLVGTAQSALALAAQATVAGFTLYFALAAGPRYREKLLTALAHDPAARQRALTVLGEIHRQIEQYMVNRLLLNAALGAVLWGIYAAYGLQHAAVWALGTALLHFIPYVGPAVGLVPPTLMAALQYGTVKDVSFVAGVYVLLVSLQGNLADPIFLGKQLRLSSIAVFLGSLFWFWIWGPVGLFLAVPLLSSIRAVCRHFPRGKVVGDLLGE
jgi:predicted PurR-regulated permease PerM